MNESALFLDKAERSLRAAESLAEAGDLDFAARQALPGSGTHLLESASPRALNLPYLSCSVARIMSSLTDTTGCTNTACGHC
jgi:hypothetical protein